MEEQAGLSQTKSALYGSGPPDTGDIQAQGGLELRKNW